MEWLWLASGEPDHAPEILIPQRVAQRRDGGAQRQDRRGFHAANRAVAILEPIIGNARIEMVDMMETDISGDHCRIRGSRRYDDPRSAASVKLQFASCTHSVCSNRCCTENNQTPMIEATTMIGS